MREPDGNKKKKKRKKTAIAYCCVIVILCVVFFWAVNTGSIHISARELVRGLFVEYNPSVAAVYDLRFPRILIAMLAGAGVAVSGVLFQAVLKNPLADPGIIGVSAGANCMSVCITLVFPALFFIVPVFAFSGGVIAFFLVYVLSWKDGLSPLRIVLTGVAISAFFTGVYEAIGSISVTAQSGVASIVSANINQKTWEDVQTLLPYTVAGLLLAILFWQECNLLSLEDKTARGLGLNVNKIRVILSLIAVLLASISTAVVGAISFLGLIVPHIGRLLVGSDHRKLIPFAALAGACTFLLADTLGRAIMAPYEIQASVIMNILGGPFFILLLRMSNRTKG